MIDQAQGLRTLTQRASDMSRVDALLLAESLPQRSTKCTTIAVTSGKGGVGKTNVSINLALLLSKMGKKVILFDADLGLANVNILMGLNPAFTLLDIVEGRCALQDVVLPGPGGISLIPGGSGVEKMANLDSATLARVMRDLDALEASCDFLIFDTGAGISRIVRSFVNAAMKQIVVVTPEPSSLADAYAAIKMIFATGNSDISIISNMVKDDKEGLETYQKLAALCRRFLKKAPLFLGSLPMDKNVRTSVSRQSPVTISCPESPFSRSLSRIVLRVMGRPVAERNGFFHRLMASMPS